MRRSEVNTKCLLKHSLPYFFKQAKSLNLTSQLDWLPSKSLRSSCLCLPVLGLQASATVLGFYMSAKDLNSGPGACKESALPTKHSPQVLNITSQFHILVIGMGLLWALRKKGKQLSRGQERSFQSRRKKELMEGKEPARKAV